MGLEGKVPRWVPGHCGKVECNSGEDCSRADVSNSHPVAGFSQMMRPVYSRNQLVGGGMAVEAGQLPGRRVGSCKAMNGRHSADAREESTSQDRKRRGVDLRRLRSSSSYCYYGCFGGCTQVQLRGIRTDVDDPVAVEAIRWVGKHSRVENLASRSDWEVPPAGCRSGAPQTLRSGTLRIYWRKAFRADGR